MRLAHLLLAFPLLGASPAATPLAVTLSNFRFDPAVIRLVHGRPYVLRLVNQSDGGHNFVAPDFLAAARVGRGKIEVPGNGTVDVALVAPAAGRYKVKCTHFTHTMRGMKGTIIVE